MRNPRLAVEILIFTFVLVGAGVPLFAVLQEKGAAVSRLMLPENDEQSPLKSVNINKIASKLGVLGYAVSSYAPVSVIQMSQDSSLSVNEVKPAVARLVPPELSGQPLVYPSPTRAALSSEVGYYLSDNMDIELRIYDMAGNMVFGRTFAKGALGGKVGYNTLPINSDAFGTMMQAGVYFVLVMAEGKVIGKTKFAVVP